MARGSPLCADQGRRGVWQGGAPSVPTGHGEMNVIPSIFLSQFKVRSWLVTYDPNPAECEQLMDYVFGGLTLCGPTPTGAHEILLEVRREGGGLLHGNIDSCLRRESVSVDLVVVVVCMFVYLFTGVPTAFCVSG